LPRLAGVRAVVNCTGILEGKDSEDIHVNAPTALFAACLQAGVRRVIHVSAISADEDAGTDYARTKRRGEEALSALALDWIILRPSLVYGEGSYGGSSLLRGLAALPFVIPVAGRGDQPFSPIHVEDLATTIARLLDRPEITRISLSPVGPETITLKQLLIRLRAWLDLPEAYCLSVPMPLIRLAGKIGALAGLKTLRPTAIRQIEHGNAGPVEPFAAVIGFTPRSLSASMTARPSHVQDRWHARLYFVKPVLRLTLGVTWLLSGLIGLTQTGLAAATFGPAMGLSAGAAANLFVAFCLVDLAIAGAVLARWRPSLTATAQLGLILGYTAVLTTIAPGLWLDPFGALVKNAAVIVAVLALAAMDNDR